MQALHLQKPGANSVLQCGLESLDTVTLCFLQLWKPSVVLVHWVLTFVLSRLSMLVPSVMLTPKIFCQRLHQVGFERGPNGIVHDQIGEFRVLLCPFGELRFRLQLAWVSIMAVHVQHRPSFRGFRLVDVVHTRAAYLKFDPFEGVLRKHRPHSPMSMPNIGPKIAALYVPNAPPWTPFITGCGNVLPRKPCVTSCLWTSFALSTHCRLSCESMVGLFVPVLPMLGSNISIASLAKFSFLHCHGWPPSWTCSLMGLACLYPAVSDLRMASWSVILARPYALDFGPQDFFAVAAQPLAGLLQSAYRAELFAIVTAMRFALVHRRPLRIWTDRLPECN